MKDTNPLEEVADLKIDVMASLRHSTEHGAWVDAKWIGLACGFDRPCAARRVQGVLKQLVNQGIAEEERSQRTIIYRWKA